MQQFQRRALAVRTLQCEGVSVTETLMMHASSRSLRSIACSVAAAALLPLGARAQAQTAPSLAKGPAPSATSAGRSLLPPGSKEGDWTIPGHDYGSTRYSELDKITTTNVAQLKESWSYTTGIADGHEGQPLVVGGRMYVVTPYPNKLVAFDLSKPGPAKLWEYAPPIDQTAFGKACCDDVNRGASYSGGNIIYNVLDNATVAVNAITGKQVWRTKLADPSQGSTMTMAPLVAKGKVYVGNSGGEMGVRGWLTALNAKTGKIIWQAFNTGPDKDVKIGSSFNPFYAAMKPANMGVTSWRGDQWKIGGATVWGWVTYDPESNSVFYGTANPGTWNPDLRPGDNLYSTSAMARDADTGELKWAYQYTPHDAWDYDGVNEHIVADIPFNGATRKVVVHFDRNGFAYTIDRTTGEVLVAQPFQYLNWATGVDLTSGRPTLVEGKQTHQGRMTTNICPSSTGARDQQPAAFSPRTHLFYTPATNLCMDYGGIEAKYIAGTPYVGAAVKMYGGPGGNRGEFLAWDAGTGKKVWGIKENFPVWSGALVTAGDVVFYGTMDGDFKAVNAANGEVLWKTHFNSGIIGNPITFLGPDGKQYIAVYEGVGGWAGAIVPGNLSADDPFAALGAVNAMRDLPDHTKAGGALHVFVLP
jgi:lanthanide-dependent methanol dehydrogenase